MRQADLAGLRIVAAANECNVTDCVMRTSERTVV